MSKRELQIEDFSFSGPLGCQGATIEKVGRNHFKVIPGHAPKHPEWPNMINFTIRNGAEGNRLRLDVSFDGGTGMRFNSYSYSWSYNGIDWRPVHWEKKNETDTSRGDSLWFPEFEQFDVSAFLCEGAGHVYLKQDCLDAGRALMHGIARYCSR